MLYPNLKAVYHNGTLKLQKPLKIPEGTAVQVSVQITTKSSVEHVMEFAGAWSDMPDAAFNDFLKDVNQRREAAFS
jgi:predicted DNA-binding antitoxin AbrB/MazE fold protein